jgi:hypothetical protein
LNRETEENRQQRRANTEKPVQDSRQNRQDWRARTRQPEQDSKNRATRTGKPEQDN